MCLSAIFPYVLQDVDSSGTQQAGTVEAMDVDSNNNIAFLLRQPTDTYQSNIGLIESNGIMKWITSIQPSEPLYALKFT